MPDRAVLTIEFSAKRQGPVLLLPQTVQQIEALRQTALGGRTRAWSRPSS